MFGVGLEAALEEGTELISLSGERHESDSDLKKEIEDQGGLNSDDRRHGQVNDNNDPLSRMKAILFVHDFPTFQVFDQNHER